MKKSLLLKTIPVLLLVFLAAACAYYYFRPAQPDTVAIGSNEHEDTDASDNPIARMEYEFDLVKNPTTGKIPEGIYEAEMHQARAVVAAQQQSRVDVNSYAFQGPNNMGGRVRSIVYDVRYNGTSNQILLAGGVSGGLFKSIDNGATWVRKSPTNQLYSVTSIAQDPRVGQQDTWYYATGEAVGNSASETGATYLGNGIYKSTDNGETWTRLANSNTSTLETFNTWQDCISKVVVNPANGDVLFAAVGSVFRSTDGGANWTQVLTSGSGFISTSWIGDLVVTSTGSRFYASFSGLSCSAPDGCPTLNTPGVWTSTTGASGSWTKIAGATAATSPAGWDANNSYRRVVLALAPSNENILYALYDDGDVNPAIEAELYRWDQVATTWTDLSANVPDEPGVGLSGNDPFAVQQGYDLVVAVKPDNANVVFLGGTNIYRSTDGFTTTGNTTRIGGYVSRSSYGLYLNSHPDIHSIVFQPGSPAIMLCGNDGGIQRTNDNLAGTVAWTDISVGFRTYQYYKVALDPRNANGKVMGGAQDNGTTRNVGGTGSNFERILSGDGASVGLSNDIGGGNFVEYVSSQLGSAYRRLSTVGPDLINADIRPAGATDNGLFVTLFHLDPDNTQTIYYCSDSSLYRNLSASTATTANWTNMTGIQTTLGNAAPPKTRITAVATTRGTYNPATASLFLGTNEGRLYRLDDPVNAAPASVPVDITGAGFPAGGNISGVAVNPRNDDTVLVTFSNYGITSVFWTGNANSATPTWLNVEGTLTLPSYRCATIAITNNGVEYFVGTSVGLYAATINSASPGTTAWAIEGGTTVGFAPVVSMALRTVDNRFLIGTHGYGMWATTLTGAGLPVNFTSFAGKVQERQNQLLWTVENEVDNQGYEVQRKYKHESTFSKIGFVAAKSGTANSYTFTDGFVDLGIDNVSYRLKQIDIDADFTYSSTITLTRKISTKLVEYLSVRGNSLLMRLNGQSNQRITFRLFDNNGRLLKQQQLPDQTQEVSLAGLPRATFVVEITHPDGRRHSQKIVY